MPERHSRFVLLCQQLLVFGTVAAMAAPGLGVSTLDIVSPHDRGAGRSSGQSAGQVAMVAAEPVAPEVTEHEVDGVEAEGLEALGERRAERVATDEEVAALSAPADVDGYATVGVTWDAADRREDDEVRVTVRSLEGGVWSDWETVEYHDEHGPDPDSAEAAGVRAGTDPIVVGDVDSVQVKVETTDGTAPADTELAVVDPRPTAGAHVAEPEIDTGAGAAGPAAADEARPTGAGAALAAVSTPKPRIFSRRQWGADERLRDGAPRYHEVHAGFVHHTVNANGYSRDRVPALIRGIYAYHTQSRGWSDIGYNFIVDRFGRIWEGRYGGVARPVVGAHTLGYNEYSFAMSALGNFETARPSSAMLEAYGRLFAWKLSLHGVDAADSRQRVGDRTFRAVNGHRDAGQTACPGRYLYARLDRIRTLADDYQRSFSGRDRKADLAGSRWPDLVARNAGTKRLYQVRTGGQTGFEARRRAAGGWGSRDIVVAPGDLTGDGIPDLLGRSRSSGEAAIHPGTRSGTFGRALRWMGRFRNADQIEGVRDLDRDGDNDLVARVVTDRKRLYFYPGNGRGGFGKRRLLSSSWWYDLTAGVGDLTRDGRPDLVARTGSRLFLFPGTRRGIGSRILLDDGFSGYRVIAGGGDLTNDGRPDLLAKGSNRLVRIFPGTKGGRLGAPLGPFRGFRNMSFLGVAGRMVGGRGAEVVSRNADGEIFVHPNNDARNIEAVRYTGQRLGSANLLLNVGDWNRDGHGDVMTRSGRTGRMYLYRGNGRGGLADPVRAATGWGSLRRVAAVGDVTGDGNPDLMGQPSGGAVRIYPGNGRTGFRESYRAYGRIEGNLHLGLGRWTGDGAPDSLVRRTDGTLAVYPGNGPGGLMRSHQVSPRAGSYRWLRSLGDLDGDGRPDLLGRDRKGTLWFLPGNRDGFGPRRYVGGNYDRFDLTG